MHALVFTMILRGTSPHRQHKLYASNLEIHVEAQDLSRQYFASKANFVFTARFLAPYSRLRNSKIIVKLPKMGLAHSYRAGGLGILLLSYELSKTTPQRIYCLTIFILSYHFWPVLVDTGPLLLRVNLLEEVCSS